MERGKGGSVGRPYGFLTGCPFFDSCSGRLVPLYNEIEILGSPFCLCVTARTITMRLFFNHPRDSLVPEGNSDKLITYGCVCVWGGGVAQSVEHETPGVEVPGSIRAVAARSLLAGPVSV